MDRRVLSLLSLAALIVCAAPSSAQTWTCTATGSTWENGDSVSATVTVTASAPVHLGGQTWRVPLTYSATAYRANIDALVRVYGQPYYSAGEPSYGQLQWVRSGNGSWTGSGHIDITVPAGESRYLALMPYAITGGFGNLFTTRTPPSLRIPIGPSLPGADPDAPRSRQFFDFSNTTGGVLFFEVEGPNGELLFSKALQPGERASFDFEGPVGFNLTPKVYHLGGVEPTFHGPAAVFDVEGPKTETPLLSPLPPVVIAQPENPPVVVPRPRTLGDTRPVTVETPPVPVRVGGTGEGSGDPLTGAQHASGVAAIVGGLREVRNAVERVDGSIGEVGDLVREGNEADEAWREGLRELRDAGPSTGEMASGGAAASEGESGTVTWSRPGEPSIGPGHKPSLVWPGFRGRGQVDLDPFRPDRFGWVASLNRQVVGWLAVVGLAVWVFGEMQAFAVSVTHAPQASGNPVLGGTGAQATALLAAGLISAVVVSSLSIIASFTLGEWSIMTILQTIFSQPWGSIPGALLWLLNQWLPVSLLVSCGIFRLSWRMYALPLYVGSAALIRWIVP